MAVKFKVVGFEDCKACSHHRGMHNSFVRCNRIKEFVVLSLSMPSNYNDGFKNGERIVMCANTK